MKNNLTGLKHRYPHFILDEFADVIEDYNDEADKFYQEYGYYTADGFSYANFFYNDQKIIQHPFIISIGHHNCGSTANNEFEAVKFEVNKQKLISMITEYKKENNLKVTSKVLPESSMDKNNIYNAVMNGMVLDWNLIFTFVKNQLENGNIKTIQQELQVINNFATIKNLDSELFTKNNDDIFFELSLHNFFKTLQILNTTNMLYFLIDQTRNFDNLKEFRKPPKKRILPFCPDLKIPQTHNINDSNTLISTYRKDIFHQVVAQIVMQTKNKNVDFTKAMFGSMFDNFINQPFNDYDKKNAWQIAYEYISYNANIRQIEKQKRESTTSLQIMNGSANENVETEYVSQDKTNVKISPSTQASHDSSIYGRF